MTRAIVAWFGDTHAGHRLGLMPPGLTLYQEDEFGNLHPWQPTLTTTQEYLWQLYLDDIAAVGDLAAGDPIIAYHVGDLTQGMKYRDQLVSSRLADQFLIARHNLAPWFDLDNLVRLDLIVGTPSHTFAEATAPILVKEILEARTHVPIRVVYHARPTIHNVIFDAAHHGPSSGIREWTQGNQLRYYLRSLMIHDVLRGRHPPHLVLRAHFHKYWPENVRIRISDVLLAFLLLLEQARATDGTIAGLPLQELWAQNLDTIAVYESQIILLPSYCGMGEHGRKATGSSSTLSNGLVAAEIIDGRLHRVHAFETVLDIRSTETIHLCSSEKDPPETTDPPLATDPTPPTPQNGGDP
jgi:hypothetical protein